MSLVEQEAYPETIYSGIQPSGIPHVSGVWSVDYQRAGDRNGNYLGFIEPFVNLQNSVSGETKIYLCIASLHALTLPREKGSLKRDKWEILAMLIACGVDPEKTYVYFQDDVPEHTELGWILNTLCPMKELEEISTWKSQLATKAGTSVGGITKASLKLGLLSYPVLQAADILLFKGYLENLPPLSGFTFSLCLDAASGFTFSLDTLHTLSETFTPSSHLGVILLPQLSIKEKELKPGPSGSYTLLNTYARSTKVPIGADQTEHLVLTRLLAREFNQSHQEIFPLPRDLTVPSSRILNLQDARSKMSKSHPNPNSKIYMNDPPSVILHKIIESPIEPASGGVFAFDPEHKPLFSNLIVIASSLSHRSIDEIVDWVNTQSWDLLQFKHWVGHLVGEKLDIVRQKYTVIRLDHDYLRSVAASGKQRAGTKARETMLQVREAVGLGEI